MMLVTKILQQHLMQQPQRKPDYSLFVSEFGLHPKTVLDRVSGIQKQFDFPTRVKMDNGVGLEAQTHQALYQYKGRVHHQFPLYNNLWSGYADFVLDHGGIAPAIVEHKATSDKWWKEYNPIKSTHVCQLWLYGELYSKMYAVCPTLHLFYRSWGGVCEAVIDGISEREVHLSGMKDGQPCPLTLPIALRRLQEEMEAFYSDPSAVDVPDSIKIDTWTYPEERTALWYPPGTPS
jgi:hypothetical protein